MLVCFAWIVAQLLDQRPSFLAVVGHIIVVNTFLPRFPLFHCQRLCQFVSCRDGGCGEGVLFVNWMHSLHCSARSVASPGTYIFFCIPMGCAFWLSHEQPSQSDHSFLPGMDQCHISVCLSLLRRPSSFLFFYN